MSNNIFKLVSLFNAAEYKTGTELGHVLGVSRSAIWKMIEKLREYEINVTSDKKLGYKLKQKLHLIDQSQIQKAIAFDNVCVDVLESIGSTNEYLKNINMADCNHYICIAEHQSKGKGRLKRNWDSPFAQNIYFSMAHVFQKDISALAGFSMIVSLSILRTLQNFLTDSADLKIKWPNDIYWKDNKIAGVIIETIGESHGGCKAIIGIGINVNMMESENIGNWTSLKKIASQEHDRNQICISLVDNLIRDIKEFEIKGFGHFITKWNQYDYLAGKTISIKNHNDVFKGLYKGINPIGHLLLHLKKGEIKEFSSGDATMSF